MFNCKQSVTKSTTVDETGIQLWTSPFLWCWLLSSGELGLWQYIMYILGILWQQKIKNVEILKRLKIKTSHILCHAIKQKLTYFGHIKRHSSLEREIMEGRVEGKRKQGRPKIQWKDDIVKWLQTKNIAEAGRLAEDRVNYRRRVWAATSKWATFHKDKLEW